MAIRPKQRPLFRTRSVDLGRIRVASIDNIAELLAIAEGEDFVEHGVTLCSTDGDFSRFPGLRLLNPLAPQPGAGIL
jgi:hypothetical protein